MHERVVRKSVLEIHIVNVPAETIRRNQKCINHTLLTKQYATYKLCHAGPCSVSACTRDVYRLINVKKLYAYIYCVDSMLQRLVIVSLGRSKSCLIMSAIARVPIDFDIIIELADFLYSSISTFN